MGGGGRQGSARLSHLVALDHPYEGAELGGDVLQVGLPLVVQAVGVLGRGGGGG